MSGTKTEKPTRKRILDARRDGQVARSDDLVQLLLFGCLAGYLILDGARIASRLVELISTPTRHLDEPFSTAALRIVQELASIALPLIFIPLVTTIVLAVLFNWLQTGPLFVVKSVTPSLKKLNVVQNIKEIFSVRTLVDTLKMVIKTGIFVLVVWLVIRGNLAVLFNIPWGGPAGIQRGIGQIMAQFTLLVVSCLAALAVFDVLWQRHSLMRKLMMTKQDIKREYKENEGDPELKNRRRDFFRELVLGDAERVPMASAVITNPTHLAIALYYEPNIAPLPLIIAKGADEAARDIMAIARRNGVPVIQNIPLARSLYKQDVFRFIPRSLIPAVAEIIVLANRLRQTDGHFELEPTHSETLDAGAGAGQPAAPSAPVPDAQAQHNTSTGTKI